MMMEALVVMPAVSLAKAVLDTLLGRAVTAMADKVALVLVGVQRDVQSIHDELTMMHAFLRASSPAYTAGGGGRDNLQTAWIDLLQNLAFDIEDDLGEFMLLKWPSADLPRVAERIKALPARVEALHVLNQRYSAFVGTDRGRRHDQHCHDDSESEPTLRDDWRHQAIVGRDDDKKDLVKLVRRDGATVVAVWGMAGVGKSSLARMLYDDSVLMRRFDRRAWVTVPHPLEGAEEFGRLLQKQIGVDEENRCLVVVDDVSSHEDWEHVSRYLAANHAGGRVVVLVTTLQEDVARRCAGDDVYELKPLPYKEGQKLLCLKVYNDADYKLPKDIVKPTKFILERCQGLPLAIAAIGGILAKRPITRSEWTKLQEHLGPELESAALDVKRVISLNYDGLPYHVKFCFLYMVGIFPRNHEIRRTRLLRRLMAEVCMQKPYNMTLEEVTWRHYNKLINKRMIEPSNKARASMKSECCRVHDLVLQIFLPLSIKELQLFIMDKHRNEVPQSDVRHLVVARRERHEEKMASIKLTRLRSLTVIGKCPVSLITHKLRILRVLDLEDTIGLKNEDLKYIGQLPHLRYLGLRGTDISELPSSLQNLRFLETLDVKETKVTQLPVGIINLENLCYLRVGFNFAAGNMGEEKTNEKRNSSLWGTFADLVCMCQGGYTEGCESGCACQFSVKAPDKIDKLSNLQVLGVVHMAGMQDARNLGKLTNLRKLGVHFDAVGEARKELCSSISSLVRLEKLEVHCESLEFLKGPIEPPPRRLVSLRLCGHLSSLPSWTSSLTNLSKIKLLRTGLKQEDIEVIGTLPIILFELWEESFGEESLSFGKVKFQKLIELDIEGLEKVKSIHIEHGAFPALEKLRVSRCLELYDNEQGLSSVKSLKKLKELDLTSCGDKLGLEKELRKQISGLSNRPMLTTGKYVATWKERVFSNLYRLIRWE